MAAAPAARAQDAGKSTDMDAIVACMFEQTTEQDVAKMREFMVAALTEDADAMKRLLLEVGFSVSNLALNKCQMDYSLLSKPEFQQIAKTYGQKLGEKIMADAFAKLK